MRDTRGAGAQLNQVAASVLPEEQVHRIDHCIAKKTTGVRAATGRPARALLVPVLDRWATGDPRKLPTHEAGTWAPPRLTPSSPRVAGAGRRRSAQERAEEGRRDSAPAEDRADQRAVAVTGW